MQWPVAERRRRRDRRPRPSRPPPIPRSAAPRRSSRPRARSRRRSAGTRSPASSSTTSPGTSSATGRCAPAVAQHAGLRRDHARGSRSSAFSALPSWMKPTSALISDHRDDHRRIDGVAEHRRRDRCGQQEIDQRVVELRQEAQEAMRAWAAAGSSFGPYAVRGALPLPRSGARPARCSSLAQISAAGSACHAGTDPPFGPGPGLPSSANSVHAVGLRFLLGTRVIADGMAAPWPPGAVVRAACLSYTLRTRRGSSTFAPFSLRPGWTPRGQVAGYHDRFDRGAADEVHGDTDALARRGLSADRKERRFHASPHGDPKAPTGLPDGQPRTASSRS